MAKKRSKSKVRYKLRDLPKDMRGSTDSAFDVPPSYDVKDEASYKRRLVQCRSLTGDEEAFREAGCKREAHLMVSGGRSTLRYMEEPQRRSRDSWERLLQPEKPFNARTQSEASNARAAERHRLARRNPEAEIIYFGPTERRVREVKLILESYRQSTPTKALGLLVPTSPRPLIKAGLTKKEANILVYRARGKLITDAPDLVKSKQKVFSRRQLFEAKLGQRFGRLQDDVILRPPLMPTDSNKALVAASKKKKVRRPFILLHLGILNPRTGEAYESYAPVTIRETLEEAGADLNGALALLFGDTPGDGFAFDLTKVSRRWGLSEAAVDVFFIFRFQNKPVQAVISLTEHSVRSEDIYQGRKVDYRTLRGISLTALPELLVSLASRKERRGRKLPRL